MNVLCHWKPGTAPVIHSTKSTESLKLLVERSGTTAREKTPVIHSTKSRENLKLLVALREVVQQLGKRHQLFTLQRVEKASRYWFGTTAGEKIEHHFPAFVST